MGVNIAKHWHVRGEVFAISDCLVVMVLLVTNMKLGNKITKCESKIMILEEQDNNRKTQNIYLVEYNLTGIW